VPSMCRCAARTHSLSEVTPRLQVGGVPPRRGTLAREMRVLAAE
jgi:hypothetical protein